MKNIITKSVTLITMLAVMLTLTMPVTAQAKATIKLNRTKVTISVKKSYQLKVTGISKKATWKSSNKKVATVSKSGKVTGRKKGTAVITAKVNKKAYKCRVTVTEPTLNKTKVTLTITKKKTKPAVQLKVKNAAGRKVKWASSNKKVVTVSKNGKVVAKKKGNAVITVKVKGSKTLRCKVTVKDNRKPAPKPPVECQHVWVDHQKIVGYKIHCTCGETYYSIEDWKQHNFNVGVTENTGHGYSEEPIYETDYQECKLCHKTKPVQ